ncbi:chloride channel protein [Chelatococcus sp. GCM10030263]|uniref:chloride channel protein n=1 Tax=Chelatococcus sp. GCM10030263 TaxID=3273387 RepID=UPI00361B1560
MWLSPHAWRRRLVFWVGAILVGAISVVFAKAADWAQLLFHGMRSEAWWSPLLLTPIGFVVSVWLVRKVFPGSEGSGIPQAIAARHLRTHDERQHLLALPIAAGKILLTLLGLACGASIGREGPTVQIGAAIMLRLARFGEIAHERGLILAGSAAGISAAFNTPLAGVVFAIEEMSRAFEQRTNGLVLTAVILAGIASLGLVGNYSYFGSTQATVVQQADWLLVAVCGIGGGFFGGVFSGTILAGSRWARRVITTHPLQRSLLIAGFCGLAVAVIGVATNGATFGTGYEQAKSAVEGQALPATFWLAKLVSSLLSTLSGIPGGIFAPALAVGAGFGSMVAEVLGSDAISLAVVLGMAGYFAGVVQAPMTAFVIILEMTGNNGNVIPLMIAAMLGYGTSRLVAPQPLYRSLAWGFIEAERARQAERVRHEAAAAPPEVPKG